MFVCARRGVAPCPRYEVRLALFHQVDDVEHCFLCVLAGEEVVPVVCPLLVVGFCGAPLTRLLAVALLVARERALHELRAVVLWFVFAGGPRAGCAACASLAAGPARL